jgi:hypothetical protein
MKLEKWYLDILFDGDWATIQQFEEEIPDRACWIICELPLLRYYDHA